MKNMLRLTAALAIASAVAAGALGLTYAGTREAIAEREAAERTKALSAIFFLHRAADGALTLKVKPLADGTYALYAEGDAEDSPTYYAAGGAGRGYNSSVPIEVIAAFTNPHKSARKALAGYVEEGKLPPAAAQGWYVVGWETVKSQETPGLGEVIRDRTTNATWWGYLTGSNQPEPIDRSTRFQRQFRGMVASDFKLRRDGGDVEALTAATYTTNGVMTAIAAASVRLAGEVK